METRSTAKYVKGSPQKARLVVDLIRGRKVEEALSILQFSKKRAARPIAKALRSAIANAEQKESMIDPSDLFVTAATVDKGPTKNRRRLRPAPMGRAFQEKRPVSHITICIGDRKSEEE